MGPPQLLSGVFLSAAICWLGKLIRSFVLLNVYALRAVQIEQFSRVPRLL